MKPLTCIIAVLVLAVPQAEAAKKTARTETVEVVLSDFAFRPATLVLHHDRSYRLVLVNKGSGAHNFSAPKFFSAARMDATSAGVVVKGGIEIGKGETRTLRLVPAPGRYRLSCTHFLHAGFGMTGSVVVD